VSLKKRRLEESGVVGSLVEVKLAANVALQKDDMGVKGGMEPTTAADMVKIFRIQRHTSLAPLSLSLSLPSVTIVRMCHTIISIARLCDAQMLL